MQEKTWRFTDNQGSFESHQADQIKSLYFPLANERLMSSITPDLHGDIKTGQNSFLLTPVSRIDLVNLRSSRNFWIYINNDKVWSATGVSADLKQIQSDRFKLNAGLLWYKITRENKKIGLKAEITSFVPATQEPIEIMQVKLTNIASQRLTLIPTAGIPVYARGANNLRDHRHVTSLLQRITLNKWGIIVKPTLVFDEAGHRRNKTLYFVLGWDEECKPPRYLYPTQEMFCGEGGNLEKPFSIFKNLPPTKDMIQGKEAMGALRFGKITLMPKRSYSYTILMGIVEDELELKKIINKFKKLEQVKNSLAQTKDFWISKSEELSLCTGNSDFDNWFRWVSIQPVLRKIFGCSFLPDFDYGKGGRGWRDLWQDCFSLILTQPEKMRRLLINNFSGVRVNGSNATIIGKKEGEFISDRNNISRVWMDHGAWPLLTLNLYLNETGDFDILFEQTAYFRDHQINRSRALDKDWNPVYGQKSKTLSGKVYRGTILEHLLVENLVQFFNVGMHNHVRLESADWNDGLDMARDNGESVAFSCMYAYNLGLLSELLRKMGRRKIEISQELNMLLKGTDTIRCLSPIDKQTLLEKYFAKTNSTISGKKISMDAFWLAQDFKNKSELMADHIRKSEWLKPGFFNGYYDNQCQRVEGLKNNLMRMMLTSQVFPIMSGIATDEQINMVLKNVQKYLWDKKLKGYHLNTDFKEEQHNLGRAFSFVYGDKENGSFFNQMIVMFAYALYRRGLVKEGWKVLSSIYNMAIDTTKSRIYPCIPEYFNLEGRGMYAYLTGSASWFVLTILTQVFGLKGKDGDLLIEPKLCSEQFKNSPIISINRIFAQRKLQVSFSNPKGFEFGKYRIFKVRLNSCDLALEEPKTHLIISRKTILSLPRNRLNSIHIILR